MSAMRKAIEEGGKEKVAQMDRQRILDQNRIRTLEKKVEELARIDVLNQNLMELQADVGRFLSIDAELLVANNLLKKVYKGD
jgi:hypothetical protein